ncbi:MAG: class I SAM-dependent methyltransferase [Bacteroidaceae bacterium]|nr:class I SAM-dependent methyltransferase [Bacteroidaceae bacterium]
MDEAYHSFAYIYDTFMDNVPYEDWAQFLLSLLKKYDALPVEVKADDPLSQERNLMLDLGCGTGTLTELMAKAGFDMIGVDNSPEMLEIAMAKKDEAGLDILYLMQDMRELELYSTVGSVISVCDSVNYILDKEELLEVFKLVNNYLFPGGLFIFDFNTLYKYSEVIGDATIAENREDASFIWENYYHEAEHVNEYDLTIFVKDEDSSLFERFEETHYQRGYELSEMTELLEAAGLKVLEAIDAETHENVTDISERIYIVAQEVEKLGKPY